jgi:hypothetical protein
MGILGRVTSQIQSEWLQSSGVSYMVWTFLQRGVIHIFTGRAFTMVSQVSMTPKTWGSYHLPMSPSPIERMDTQKWLVTQLVIELKLRCRVPGLQGHLKSETEHSSDCLLPCSLWKSYWVSLRFGFLFWKLGMIILRVNIVRIKWASLQCLTHAKCSVNLAFVTPAQ